MRARIRLLEQVRALYKNMNLPVLGLTVALMLAGSAAVYSATVASGGAFFFKQITWYAAGFLVMMVMANINYNNLINIANILYWAFVALLLAVLLVGHESLGAQRWLKIGSFQFQPSEFMKIVVGLTVIRFILVRQKEAFTAKSLVWLALIVAFPVLLILRQPDLGTALLLLPVLLVILFMGNMPVKKLAGIITGGILLMPVAFLFLKDYQKQRIEVFLNPRIDPLGAGYNVIQSQIAVGSGMWSGKGFLQGTQSQLNFIPIKYTDFIFAVISEEAGFIGSFIVLLIYFALIMEGLKIVKLSKHTGGKMLAAALTAMIFSQVFINIGMNIGIMPVTGITLPLLSYGGTSVLVVMAALGMLQNVYREYMKAEE